MTRMLLQEGLARELRPLPILELPFISVIVPVRNEAAFIRRTLDQVLNQHYDPDRFEVLVADGGSTDATRAIVRDLQHDHPNLRLIDNPRQWSSAGRNQAIRVSRGEVLVVIDGHCQIDNPNYLRDLAGAFADSGADCVGRPQPLDVPAATTLQRAVAAARSSRLGHNPDSFIYSSEERFVPPQSVAVAYRRAVFDAVGLFDETFDACEDVEFNHRLARAGYRCFFTPRVRVRYHPRADLAGLFRQMVRYGRGRVRLFRKHPETFTVPCFLPGLFVVGLVLGAMLAWTSAWLALTYAAVLALYLLVVLLTSAKIAVRERDLRLLPWLPLVFAAIHLGAGTGLLREWYAGRRPWRQPMPATLQLQQPVS